MTAYLVALALFAATVGLGFLARRAPVGLDATVARMALGTGTAVAWFFTRLGYARGIVLAYVVFGVVLEIGRSLDLPALALLGIAQVVSQLVSTGLKGVFKRERPEHWLKRHELSGGYPSGHSVTAVVTYGGFAVLALASPGRGPWAPLLAESVACIALVCSGGILWSRLALGAHYLSDVAGGILLGSAMLALCARLLPSLH